MAILVNDFCNFDPSPSIKIIKRRRTREPVDVAFGHFGQHGRRPDEHLGARGNRARHLCRFCWHLDTGLQRCAKWTAKPGSIASHVSHGVAYQKSHCHHLVIICRLLTLLASMAPVFVVGEVLCFLLKCFNLSCSPASTPAVWALGNLGARASRDLRERWARIHLWDLWDISDTLSDSPLMSLWVDLGPMGPMPSLDPAHLSLPVLSLDPLPTQRLCLI